MLYMIDFYYQYRFRIATSVAFGNIRNNPNVISAIVDTNLKPGYCLNVDSWYGILYEWGTDKMMDVINYI